MSTFWLIYWIALGIIVLLSLFIVLLFDYKEYREKKPISFIYAVFAVMIGAIPGVGIAGAGILVIASVIMIFGGDLLPKENIFGENE